MTTVVDNQGKFIGIFTDGDVRRTLNNTIDIHTTPIHQIMSTNPKTIAGHALAHDALTLMETHQITALVIVDDQRKPIGVIHIHDILRAHVSSS